MEMLMKWNAMQWNAMECNGMRGRNGMREWQRSGSDARNA